MRVVGLKVSISNKFAIKKTHSIIYIFSVLVQQIGNECSVLYIVLFQCNELRDLVQIASKRQLYIFFILNFSFYSHSEENLVHSNTPLIARAVLNKGLSETIKE